MRLKPDVSGVLLQRSRQRGTVNVKQSSLKFKTFVKIWWIDILTQTLKKKSLLIFWCREREREREMLPSRCNDKWAWMGGRGRRCCGDKEVLMCNVSCSVWCVSSVVQYEWEANVPNLWFSCFVFASVLFQCQPVGNVSQKVGLKQFWGGIHNVVNVTICISLKFLLHSSSNGGENHFLYFQ